MPSTSLGGVPYNTHCGSIKVVKSSSVAEIESVSPSKPTGIDAMAISMLSWLLTTSRRSVLSIYSMWCFMSIASFASALCSLSITSLLSILGLLSVGSAVSCLSVGSVLSVMSVGSFMSIGCVGESFKICNVTGLWQAP